MSDTTPSTPSMEAVHKSFCKSVLQMLDKQQEYFRTRDPKVLGESKKMERNVRNYIETVINPTLF